MSDEPRVGRRDCGEDAAAYALGALEPLEAIAFRRHLDECMVCRDEVAAFQTVADSLPLAAPQIQAPRRLKRRVISSARRERKPVQTSVARRPRRAALARSLMAMGAALVAAVLAVGAVAIFSGGSSSRQATATRVVQARVATATGNAVVRLSPGSVELVLHRFPPPPAGKIYEVWLQRAGRAPSPTNVLFSVTATGAGAIDIPGDIRGVQRMLVTPEPLGGSSTPTHAPVIVAQLS